jgi:hypothetical protein
MICASRLIAYGQTGEIEPREVRLRGAARHATGVHRILAGHRAQPREGLSSRPDGPDSRPKGGAKGVGLPSRLEPFHLAARRKGSAPLLTPEEA